MKKVTACLIMVAMLSAGVSSAHALVVFDPANHALNTIRNILLESQHIQEMLEAAKRLLELKRIFDEFRFFNSQLIEAGFSEIRGILQVIRVFRDDPSGALLSFVNDLTGGFFSSLAENPFFQSSGGAIPHLEAFIDRAGSGNSLSFYLNQIPDPLSPNHQYITYEQAQIVRSFDQAEALREYADRLAEEGKRISEAASEANLLGATRLEASSMGKLLEVFGILLTTQGRLAELNALSLEQVSREEKMDELARRKLLEDVDGFVHGGGGAVRFVEGL